MQSLSCCSLKGDFNDFSFKDLRRLVSLVHLSISSAVSHLFASEKTFEEKAKVGVAGIT